MGANTRYIVVGPLVLVAALVLTLALSAPASGTPSSAYSLDGVTDAVEDTVEELEDTVEDAEDDPVDTVEETVDETVDEVASTLEDGDEPDEGDGSEEPGDDEAGAARTDDERDTRAASTGGGTTVTAGLPALRSGGTLSSLQGFRVQSHHSTDASAMSAPPLDDVLSPVTRDTSGDEAATSDDQALLTADRQSVAAVPHTAGPSPLALLAGGLLILALMGTAWLAGLRPEDLSGAS